MQELERRSYFKPAQISQGFQPVGAADITPLLRQNQQRQLNEQKMFAEAAMQDMRAQERMHQVAEALETREAEQLAKFSNTLLQTVGDIEKARIEDVKARASSLFYEDAAAVNEVAAEYDSNKAQLNKIRTAESDASSIAFQQGMPYEIVKRWRDMTGHARDAYGAELVANIGTLYRNYQEEQGSSNNTEIQLGNKKVRVNNPDGIAEFSGVRAYTREEFIKQLGIHNLVPGVQAKAFKEMQAVDAKLDNEYETQWNIRNGPVDRKDSTLQ
jgi:transposase-like protein